MSGTIGLPQRKFRKDYELIVACYPVLLGWYAIKGMAVCCAQTIREDLDDIGEKISALDMSMGV